MALIHALHAHDPALPPSKLAWAAEAPRAVLGLGKLLASWPTLRSAPRGDGRPVVLLPGLANSDLSMGVLRAYLRYLGYDARGWGMGRNRGPRTIGGDGARLAAHIAAIQAETGQRVTLVGVSLGGIMARILAHRRPELVREVITISSPFAGSGRATNVWRAYEWLSGEKVDSPAARAFLAEAAAVLPVPSTAIWSRSDGLVNGLNCRACDDAGAIEVQSGHLWVQLRAQVFRSVADVLGRE